MRYRIPRKESFKHKLFNRQAILAGDQKIWMGPGQLGSELSPGYEYAPPTYWPQLLRVPQIVVLELGTTWSVPEDSTIIGLKVEDAQGDNTRTWECMKCIDPTKDCIGDNVKNWEVTFGGPGHTYLGFEDSFNVTTKTTGDDIDNLPTLLAVKEAIENIRPGKTFVFISWNNPGPGMNVLPFPAAMDENYNLITPQDYFGCDYLKIIMNPLFTNVSVPMFGEASEDAVALQRAWLAEFRSKCIVDFRRQRDKFYNYKVYQGVFPPAVFEATGGSMAVYDFTPTFSPPLPIAGTQCEDPVFPEPEEMTWTDADTGEEVTGTVVDYVIYENNRLKNATLQANAYGASVSENNGPIVRGDPGNPLDNLQYFNTAGLIAPEIANINGALDEEVITFLGEVGVSMSAGYIMDLIANHFKFDLGSGQDL